MTLRDGKRRPDTVSGLRTRFYPKSRIGQGLMSLAPWLDVVLLGLLFALAGSKVSLQPGVLVELPDTVFTEGSRYGLIAVVLSVGDAQSRAKEEIVFFDDERFRLRDTEQTRALKASFRERAGEHPEADLVIQADSHVPHGAVVEIINMALEVGIKRVNIAGRPRQE